MFEYRTERDYFIDIGSGLVRLSEVAAVRTSTSTPQVAIIWLRSGEQVWTEITVDEFRTRLKEATP